MPDFAEVIRDSLPIMRARAKMRGGRCSVMEQLCGESVLYKEGELEGIRDYLAQKGFEEVEYLGSGSNAVVVAPKDNDEIVFRVRAFKRDDRANIPYMLQTIGDPIHLCGVAEDGRMLGGYEVEFLKRLDMSVSDKDLRIFLQQVQGLGYQLHSLAGGEEVGWYRYSPSEQQGVARSLIFADPSGPSKGSADGLPVMGAHPTLMEQLQENKRLCDADSRLAFLVPALEKQRDKVPPSQRVHTQRQDDVLGQVVSEENTTETSEKHSL